LSGFNFTFLSREDAVLWIEKNFIDWLRENQMEKIVEEIECILYRDKKDGYIVESNE
jgi:hypothetical protein